MLSIFSHFHKSHLYLLHVVLLRVLEGADIPAEGAERASFETGLPFCDAIDLSEDGTSQQDVDPGVQNLVTSCHSDTCYH